MPAKLIRQAGFDENTEFECCLTVHGIEFVPRKQREPKVRRPDLPERLIRLNPEILGNAAGLSREKEGSHEE